MQTDASTYEQFRVINIDVSNCAIKEINDFKMTANIDLFEWQVLTICVN